MKDKLTKQITFRIPAKDYERLVKVLGPYAKLAALIRDLIKDFLKKSENKAA